jgi:hypothetical protein
MGSIVDDGICIDVEIVADIGLFVRLADHAWKRPVEPSEEAARRSTSGQQRQVGSAEQ